MSNRRISVNSKCVIRITANRWQMGAFKARLLLSLCSRYVCSHCLHNFDMVRWTACASVWEFQNWVSVPSSFERFFIFSLACAHTSHIDPWNGFARRTKKCISISLNFIWIISYRSEIFVSVINFFADNFFDLVFFLISNQHSEWFDDFNPFSWCAFAKSWRL